MRNHLSHKTSQYSLVFLILLMFSVLVPTVLGVPVEETDEDLIYLDRINRAFVKLVNRALPSIVQINTTKKMTRDPHEGVPGFPFRMRPPEGHPETLALGSGVIVSEDGYILTNNHVVADATRIYVTLADEREFEAELVGTDQYTEIAVIRVPAEGLPSLPLGNSEALEVGEWVVAMGSPFRLAQSVTRGVVSAKGRSQLYIVGDQGYEDFIQTDAAINPGNSGGALINIRGELIGINTAILTGGPVRANAGVGFAVPINMATMIMESLKKNGRVIRGWLGVGIRAVTDGIAETLQLPQARGALVTNVYEPSPAHEAGLQLNDVITAFDGKPIDDQEHLRNTVAVTEVDRLVDMRVIREGKEITLRIKIAERTEEVLAQASGRDQRGPGSGGLDDNPMEGLQVRDLTPQIAEELGYQGLEGVIVTEVAPDSAADTAGIEVGDLIQEVEMQDVRTAADFGTAAQGVTGHDRVILYVHSPDGAGSYVVLKAE